MLHLVSCRKIDSRLGHFDVHVYCDVRWLHNTHCFAHLFDILCVSLQDAGAGKLSLVLINVPQPHRLVTAARSYEIT